MIEKRDDEELTLAEAEAEFGIKADTLRAALARYGTLVGQKRPIPGSIAPAWHVTRAAVRDWLARQGDPSKTGPKLKRREDEQHEF